MEQNDSKRSPQKPKRSSGKRKAASRSNSAKRKPKDNEGGAYSVVDRTTGWFRCLTDFETDLPPHCRAIHPSGVLHVLGAGRPDASDTCGEEQAFAWIEDSFYVESALNALKERGLDAEGGASFLPYSTREKWIESYPHAKLTMVCSANGTCTAADKDGDASEPSKKRSKGGKASSAGSGSVMLRDDRCLPDAERDELHVEIYRYLRWLHSRLTALEEESRAGGWYEKEAKAAEDEEASSERGPGSVKRDFQWILRNTHGMYVTELGVALEKLADAFGVIKRFVGEEEEEARAGGTKDEEPRNDDNESIAATGSREKDADGGQVRAPRKEPTGKPEDLPLLEGALVPALSLAVSARVAAGRRRRRRGRVPLPPGPNGPHRVPSNFDECVEKLVRYKEMNGDCLVPLVYEQDKKLGVWVMHIRRRRKEIRERGMEYEELSPGRKIRPKTLTRERIDRLDSVGFVWEVKPPRVPWEEHFQQVMRFHEENGKWPTQATGALGLWVLRQRQQYAKGDAKFMKTRFPKLDEVGFDWVPRGNVDMSWDKGYEMLMEYKRNHGHFTVERPEPEKDDSRKSDEVKFYNWVRSLHGMYRQYRLGRRSGSLTEERIMMLVKEGFTFQDSCAGDPMSSL